MSETTGILLIYCRTPFHLPPSDPPTPARYCQITAPGPGRIHRPAHAGFLADLTIALFAIRQLCENRPVAKIKSGPVLRTFGIVRTRLRRSTYTTSLGSCFDQRFAGSHIKRDDSVVRGLIGAGIAVPSSHVISFSRHVATQALTRQRPPKVHIALRPLCSTPRALSG